MERRRLFDEDHEDAVSMSGRQEESRPVKNDEAGGEKVNTRNVKTVSFKKVAFKHIITLLAIASLASSLKLTLTATRLNERQTKLVYDDLPRRIVEGKFNEEANAKTVQLPLDETVDRSHESATTRGDKEPYKVPQSDGSKETPSSWEQTYPSRRIPIMIAIEYTDATNVKVSPLDVSYHQPTNFNEESMPKNPPQITLDWFTPNAHDFIDGYDWAVCEPMYDWQLQSYPNCNSFHELDYSHMRVINSGGSRIAFEMKQQLVDDRGKEAKFVYKTARWEKGVSAKLVEEQRKDSLVMERTSSSQFITHVHGYCSLGIMMEFMPEGDMHDYTQGARLAGGSTLSPVDRLRISIHIATSVADLHTIDGTPMPSMFHNDLWSAQYLFQNGIFLLSDFNYARPIYINKKTNEQCRMSHFGMAYWKGRSLEEHQKHFQDRNFRPVPPDVVDVWMMGTQIYTILTDLYTFEKPKNLDAEESGKELMAGRRSPYPEHIENSNDPSYIVVKKALEMCWTQDWKERPSARSISDYLIGQLKDITGEENPDVRVVLPERDPNQRSTESDFDEYNQ